MMKRKLGKINSKKGFLLVILLILPLLLVSNAYAFESFTVDPQLIVERMTPGQIKPFVIRVTNIIDEDIIINVTKEEVLEEFTHVNLKQMTIPANDTRTVYLEFYSNRDVSQRVEGNISFIIDRRGITPEIKHTKVILDIQKIKEENVVIKGLDEYDVINPGDDLKITFDVGRDFMNYNFSSEISYFLLDSDENIIWHDEDLFNEYSKNISVTLRVPNYIADGDYQLKINVKVLGKLVNTATKDIKVEGIKAELRNYIGYLLAIVAMLVIVIIVEIFKRKLKLEKELFLF